MATKTTKAAPAENPDELPLGPVTIKRGRFGLYVEIADKEIAAEQGGNALRAIWEALRPSAPLPNQTTFGAREVKGSDTRHIDPESIRYYTYG